MTADIRETVVAVYEAARYGLGLRVAPRPTSVRPTVVGTMHRPERLGSDTASVVVDERDEPAHESSPSSSAGNGSYRERSSRSPISTSPSYSSQLWAAKSSSASLSTPIRCVGSYP